MKKKAKLIFSVAFSLIIIATAVVFFYLRKDVPFGGDSLEGAIILTSENNKFFNDGKIDYIDRDNHFVVPITSFSITFIPVRFIAENLDYTVDYDSSKGQVVLTKDDNVITAKVGSNEIIHNGVPVKIDEANPDAVVMNLNERIYLPLKLFAEILDKKVVFDRGLLFIGDNVDKFSKSEDYEQRITQIISNLGI